MKAPMAKASSLNLNVGTPISSAASSSSRVASQARPTRLSLIRHVGEDHARMTTSASQ